MVYLVFIKAFRWWTFLTFFAAVIVFAFENAHDFDRVTEIEGWADFKSFTVINLAVLISIVSGAVFLTDFRSWCLAAYYTNHYTIVIGDEPQSYAADEFWEHVWPEIRTRDDVRVYYNDFSGTKFLHRFH